MKKGLQKFTPQLISFVMLLKDRVLQNCKVWPGGITLREGMRATAMDLKSFAEVELTGGC